MSLFPPDGSVMEDVVDHLFCCFASAECRVHDANSLRVRLQATVSCSQPEYSGLFMSCQMVDWVCRGVVVSSGSSSLTDQTAESAMQIPSSQCLESRCAACQHS